MSVLSYDSDLQQSLRANSVRSSQDAHNPFADDLSIGDIEPQSLEDILNEDTSTPSEIDVLIAEATGSEGGGATLNDRVSHALNGRTEANYQLTSFDPFHASKSPSTSSLSSSPSFDCARAAELVPLQAICAEMTSTVEEMNAGQATCMAVSLGRGARGKGKHAIGDMIAIGTCHGVILLFDLHTQTRLFIINSRARRHTLSIEYGACSSISFSPNGTKLVVAYARGHLQLIDVRRGRVINTLKPEQAHSDAHGILHVEYMDSVNTCVLVDTGGNVFSVKYSATLSGQIKAKSNCVFSGCHGEVCTVAPLHITSHDHRLIGGNAQILAHMQSYKSRSILAMASLTKVIVIALHPQPIVIYAVPLLGAAPSMPPLVAWQWMSVSTGGNLKHERVVDPILAMCRGGGVVLTQIHLSGGELCKAFVLTTLSLASGAEPINLTWMNHCTLGVMTADEHLYLYDVTRGSTHLRAVIDVVDCAASRLVYATATYKGLSTGGRVSAALQCLADRTAYQSIVSNHEDSLYILGTNSLHVVNMRTWLQRVDALLEGEEEYKAALALGVHFYTGKARLPHKTKAREEQRRGQIADKMVDVALEYLERLMTRDLPKSLHHDVLGEHYKQSLPSIVDALVTIKRTDVLYEEIYTSIARSRVGHGVLLECLESYVMDGQLPDMPPSLVQSYLQHLADEQLFDTLEQSITHLPIHLLDIHQVMTFCASFELWDGVVYVHNRALKDYITPLRQMFIALRKAMLLEGDVLSDVNVQLGNKILLYISCCVSGQAYPTGVLEEEESYVVVRDVTHALITPHDPTLIVDPSESSPIRTDHFPYIRTLLQFNTRDFLNVLLLAFHGDLFRNEWGVHVVKQILNVLMETVHTYVNSKTDNGSVSIDLGAFLTFIARLIGNDRQRAKDVDKEVINQIVCASILSCRHMTAGSFAHDEREQAVVALLAAIDDVLDVDQVVEAARRANFWILCEHVYRQKEEWTNVIDCYMLDAIRKPLVFQCIRRLLAPTSLSDNQVNISSETRDAIHCHIYEHLDKLCAIDVDATARMIVDVFDLASVAERMHELREKNADTCTKLLVEMQSIREEDGASLVFTRGDYRLFDQLIKLLIAGASSHDMIDTSTSFESLLLHTLRATVNDVAVDARYDFIMSQCIQHDILSVRVMLLERRQEWEEAHAVLGEVLDAHIKEVKRGEGEISLDGILTCIAEYMSFLTRCQHIDQVSHYWSTLFDTLLTHLPPTLIRSCTPLSDALSKIVHSLVRHEPADRVLGRLLNHDSFRECTYAEHKHLISSIINVFDYEQVLITSLLKCMHDEGGEQLIDSSSTGAKGVKVVPSSSSMIIECVVCREPICHPTDEDTTNALAKCLLFSCMRGASSRVCRQCNESESIDPARRSTLNIKDTPHPQTPVKAAQMFAQMHTPSLDTLMGPRKLASTNPFDTAVEGEVECARDMYDEHIYPLRLAPKPEHMA